MRTYIKNITSAVSTMFEGLTITFSHLFRQPITVQYPDRTPRPVVQTLPERYRGILDLDEAKCTGCMLCMQTCPIECIYLEAVKLEGRKGRAPTIFNIDVAKCMYCGLCAEICPTGAIFHTRTFEGATEDVEDMIHRHLSVAEKVERERLSKAQAEAKAKAKAKEKAEGEKPKTETKDEGEKKE
jgi:NADH-quinone oxidoreductase chain I